MVIAASAHIQNYFDALRQQVRACYDIAEVARKKGLDPEETVPIPLAQNMAERVVGLISVVAPQITQTNVTQRLIELEQKYGLLDWRVGFTIAEEIAKQEHCTFTTKQEAMEVGIRVGFAYLTLGIVSAPLEGFTGLKIKKRRDGQEYFALQYAGPIRGAGGTAASISVILSDYVRVKMGYAPYDPDETEIKRYVAEVHDYHERVTNLQYFPSEQEIAFMVGHLPVEVDGDPTERFEVSNYKDLPRIETNLIRGGVALVLAEGLCQKAPKLWKRLSKWGKETGLEWDWLPEFITLKEQIHAAHKSPGKEEEGVLRVKPNNTFIMDLVAGRPILTHPLGEGGLRLRYGRTRTTGFSAAGLHPATLIVLDKYIAIGTQLKVERPGKAASVTVCDALDGPIVRLKDQSVIALQSEEDAKKINSEVEEILYLGDILFNYGDFSENGQRLCPPGYCPEWWVLEVQKAITENFSGDMNRAAAALALDKNRLEKILQDYFFSFPSFEEAVQLSTALKVPLHPDYTFYYNVLSREECIDLISWFLEAKVKKDEKGVAKIILPLFSSVDSHYRGKKVLEHAGIPHKIINKENVVIERKEAQILCFCLGFETHTEVEKIVASLSTPSEKKGLELFNTISPVLLRDKAGTFVGARMGRPEKAKMRQMTGSPQAMFPVGDEGDRLRSIQSALKAGKVHSAFPLFYCSPCQRSMVYGRCEECGQACIRKYACRLCGDLDQEMCRHGKGVPYKYQDIDIMYFFTKAMERLKENVYPDLIKGIRGTSNKEHLVEHLSKGILRAKHGIYVNKEGTTRYDCTELPITHFKSKEIGTSVARLIELGYTDDIHGQQLVDDNQVLELKPQDLILPGFNSLDESAPQVLKRVANFVDNLLVSFYGLDPFYTISKEEDLVGHLVIGLAPHISAGLVGRIIGFSQTQGLFTHPMYHAGLRRDCDGDEACVILLMDALLNFSRKFLPNTRGSTMDSPLVLTALLNPTEIDDQVHGMDTVWKYPLEFYEAALQMKNPWDVKHGEKQEKIEQLSNRLGTPAQYEGWGYTHPVDNINKGVQCSAYKTAPTMADKLLGQMEIARKVRAVDMDDVAKLVIQKHFLKDIKGNLRKFSMQQFRCVKCSEKFRRPPMSGKCTKCTGKIIFTITEGSVVKYLGASLMLCEKYNFSPYLKETLDIVKQQVDNVFGKEKEKQVALRNFI